MAGGEPARPIIQYWHEEPPAYIAELLASFRDRNPEMPHLVFDESAAADFIGERLGQRELGAFRACAVPAMQADYFRCCAILALGGVYADADYRCISPLRSMVDSCDGGEIFLSPTTHRVNGREMRRVWNGFFAFRESGHPFLRLALEIATANMEARIPERIWPTGHNVREAIWLTVGPGVPTLMRFMQERGSFDAFIEAIAGSPAEPFGSLYCEVVGDYTRLVEAFEGIRVSPNRRMFEWIADPDFDLPYKETDTHWHNVTTAIFR